MTYIKGRSILGVSNLPYTQETTVIYCCELNQKTEIMVKETLPTTRYYQF